MKGSVNEMYFSIIFNINRIWFNSIIVYTLSIKPIREDKNQF